MNKIICDLSDFTLGAKVVVIDNNHPEALLNAVDIDSLSKILYNIYIERDIKSIAFKGNRSFAKKISEELEALSNLDNNVKTLVIEYI